MSTAQLVISIILAICCVILIAVVLLQQGARQGLSGAIAGGAETFFGKSKARGMQATLAKLTTITAIVFAVAVIAVNVF